MKRWLLPVMLSVCLLASGCDDRVELDQLGIVSALGIDLSDQPGELDITVQMIRPREAGSPSAGGSDTGRPFLVVSSTGSTLFDAIRKATTISSRKLFFAHDRILVIGRDLAESGIGGVLDLLTRDKEVRPTMKILVAKGRARDVIYSVTEFEVVPGAGMAQLLAVVDSATSAIADMNLHQFRASVISSPGVQPVVPLVDGVTSATAGDTQTESGSPPAAVSKTEEKLVRLEGSAVFKEDRLVDTLDLTESRGYRWVVNQVQSAVLVVRWPDTGEKVDMEVVTTETKTEVEMADGMPSATVSVDISTRIGAQEGRTDLTSLESLRMLESLVSDTVQHEIALAIEKARSHGTDIFGFGESLRGKDPEAWKALKDKWDDVFKHMPVEVKVEDHVRRYGLTTSPMAPTGR